MNSRSIFFALLLAAGLFGCGKQPEPRHIVILIDVSGSIDRQALDQAFKGIDELVGRLHRGDRIAIIPILGDAEAEASGRIIRFDVPIQRQAYDADLSNFRRRLGVSLKEMQAEAVAHPGSKTDIFGSIELAAQEFEGTPGKSASILVLSDFIQEDRELDFRKDKRLMDKASTRHFAKQAKNVNLVTFNDMEIHLAMMRSTEYSRISQKRRDAIHEFWIEYFKLCRGHPRFLNDGIGLALKTTSFGNIENH